MFWACLYNWLWENMRLRASHEQDYDTSWARWRRPLTGDEPRTFLEFMRRVFLAR
ncbi:MAG TPA: hypothetical protein VHW69_08310 [Rhizomicrobium sp.]|jgi:hypothetical protein|nr:hypothetical protein [Rhizomicrobium sp.]